MGFRRQRNTPAKRDSTKFRLKVWQPDSSTTTSKTRRRRATIGQELEKPQSYFLISVVTLKLRYTGKRCPATSLGLNTHDIPKQYSRSANFYADLRGNQPGLATTNSVTLEALRLSLPLLSSLRPHPPPLPPVPNELKTVEICFIIRCAWLES